ncbi:MAG: AraC-like DNA-binding protein [Candidatus Azotimanducaceae bacterium]|jgi:AraC-like DNA-binding protein
MEVILALTQQAVRKIMGGEKGLSMVTANLVCDKPKHFYLYKEYLSFHVQFNQANNAFKIPLAFLNVENPKQDSVLKALATKELDTIVKPDTSNILDETRRIIKRDLESNLSVTGAANALHMSERTLKRKLAKFNKTYTGLLAEIRVNTAMGLLERSTFSIEEIAYKVGYAHTSTFMHAFKKILQKTPTEYRRSYS